MRPPPLKQESLAEHKPAAGRAGAAVALHAVLHAIQPLTARPHWQPGRDDGLLPQGQQAAACGHQDAAAAGAVVTALRGNKLYVQVHGATHLPPHLAWHGGCNACVRLRFGGVQHSTATVASSTSPAWGSHFVFDAASVVAAADAGRVLGRQLALQLEVWHTDKLQRDRFLGQARLALRHLDLTPGSVNKLKLQLQVFDRRGREVSKGAHGSITCSVWLAPDADGAAQTQEPAAAASDSMRGRSATARPPSSAAPAAAAAGAAALPPHLQAPHTTNLSRRPGSVGWGHGVPAVHTSSKGTVYEEPCCVVFRLTLAGLVGLGAPEAARPGTPLVPATAAAAGSAAGGDAGEYDAAAAGDSLRTAAPAAAGAAGRQVYLEVSYGQAQQQTTGLYPLQANGTVVLDDLTLWFADARPLQRDCTLSIHAYLKRPSPAKDRLLGCFSVPCAQLVQQCDGATCQLPRCYVPVAAAAPFFNTTFAAAVAAGDGAAAAPAAGAEAGAAQGGACPIAAAFVAAALASATAAEAAATSCRAHGGADISSGGSMPQALQQALCCVDSGCKGDSRLAAVARRIGQGAAAAALVLHMGMSDVDLRAQHCGVPLYAAPAAELGQDHAQTQPRVLGVANSSSSSSSSSSDSSACAEDDGLVQDQAALSSMPEEEEDAHQQRSSSMRSLLSKRRLVRSRDSQVLEPAAAPPAPARCSSRRHSRDCAAIDSRRSSSGSPHVRRRDRLAALLRGHSPAPALTRAASMLHGTVLDSPAAAGASVRSQCQPPAVVEIQLQRVLPIFAESGGAAVARKQGPAAAAASGGGSASDGLRMASSARQPSTGAWFVVMHTEHTWVRTVIMAPEDGGADLAWTLLLPVFGPSAVLTLGVFRQPPSKGEAPVLMGKVQLQLTRHLPGRAVQHTLLLPADSSTDDAVNVTTFVRHTLQSLLVSSATEAPGQAAVAAATAGSMRKGGGGSSNLAQASDTYATGDQNLAGSAAAGGDDATLAGIYSQPQCLSVAVAVAGTPVVAARAAVVSRALTSSSTFAQQPQHSIKARMTAAVQRATHKARQKLGASQSSTSTGGAAADAGISCSSMQSTSHGSQSQGPLPPGGGWPGHPAAQAELAAAGVAAAVQLTVCLRFRSWSAAVAAYMKPCRPASYYKLGLHRHAKTVRELEAAAASKWLAGCAPPIPDVAEQLLMDRPGLSVRRIRLAVLRLLVAANPILRTARQWRELTAWQHPQRSATAFAIVLTYLLLPHRTLAALLLWAAVAWVRRAMSVGYGRLGLQAVLKPHTSCMPQVTELRAVEPPLRSKVAKLAGAAKQDSAGPSSSVSIKQITDAAQGLQASVHAAADAVERLWQLGRWLDPTWTLLAVLLLVVGAAFVALFGFSRVVAIVVLMKLRPPWLRAPTPNLFTCMASRLPLASER